MAVPEGLTAIVWTCAGAVLAPAVLGAGVVRWLGLSPRCGRRVFAAWSYLAGQLALAPVTYLWLACRQPLPGWSLPLLAALGGAALLQAAHRRARPAAPAAAPDRWLGLATAVLALVCIDQFLLIGVQPILGGDDADIWSAKAKALYSAPGFALQIALGYPQHADYPMLNPLVQVLAFATNGRILQFENRLPIQCFGLALLLLLSSAAGRVAPRWAAAAALVAFAGSSFSWCTMSAYADVLLALGVFGAVDGWLRWQATGEPVWWRLANVGLAAALVSKNEGAMLALAAGAAVLAVRLLQGRASQRPLGRRWWWLAVPVAAITLQRAFDAWFGLHNDLLDPALSEGRGLLAQIAHWLPARALRVAAFYGGLLVDTARVRLLVPLLLAAACVRGRALLHAQALLPLLLVGFALLGYMLVFVGTNANLGGADGAARGLEWHLATAADRTVLHVLPVAVLGLCLCLGPDRGAAAPQRGEATP
jgi:hypothetical protein